MPKGRTEMKAWTIIKMQLKLLLGFMVFAGMTMAIIFGIRFLEYMNQGDGWIILGWICAIFSGIATIGTFCFFLFNLFFLPFFNDKEIKELYK